MVAALAANAAAGAISVQSARRQVAKNFATEYWGYIGIMEKKMETTIVYLRLYRDNGKQNGNYYSIGCFGV